MTLRYSDDKIIEGLRQKKSSYIAYLYEEFGPIVRHWVSKNSGNQQDVEDLFQDTLIILYTRSLVQPFKLECSLKTYFMSICKNLWLQRLERKFRLLYQAEYEVNDTEESYVIDEMEPGEKSLDQQRLFFKNLLSLPTDCQRLIRLYCLKIPYKDIARLMNYKDISSVKSRKYLCKNLLRKKILNDPECYQFFFI